jgi:hypothetical protein
MSPSGPTVGEAVASSVTTAPLVLRGSLRKTLNFVARVVEFSPRRYA